MTPEQRMKYLDYPLALLDDAYTLPEKPIPLESGEIHIIRFIRSDLKFKIFGMTFTLPEETMYEYITPVPFGTGLGIFF